MLERIGFYLLLILSMTSFSNDDFDVFRIQGAHKILLEKLSGDLQYFPAGSRIIKRNNRWVVYDVLARDYVELVPQLGLQKRDPFILSKNACRDGSDIVGTFIHEGLEAIQLIERELKIQCNITLKAFSDNRKPEGKECELGLIQTDSEFNLFYKKTKDKFYETAKNPGLEKILFNKLEKYIEFFKKIDKMNETRKVDRFLKVLDDLFNPYQQSGKRVNDELIISPLSEEWLRSEPLFDNWFNEQWVHINISGALVGQSGEGVSIERAHQKKYFRDLIEIVKRNKIKGELARWVKSLESKLENSKKMIFIHNSTWSSQRNLWRSFIPTDQSIGCFSSHSLFSVLIHEVNVNSETFFPVDTHAVSSNNLHLLKGMSEYRGVVAREPFLQLFYLSFILSL